MTIQDVANKYGVSTSAVYKRIKAASLRVVDLMDRDTRQLTTAGEATVLALFDDVPVEQVHNHESEVDNQVHNHSTTSDKRLSEAEKTVERLEKEVERLTTQLTAAADTNRLLSDQLAKANEALERAQQLQALTLQKIPQALPAPKQGFFSRLFHHGKGGGTDGKA